MNAISKPHIVDLLRIFDKRRMVTPRIRYASVRSKPELISDLSRHFVACKLKDVIQFKTTTSYLKLPEIRYHLKLKKYTFDGVLVDVPRESREPIKFEIRRGPVVISFHEFAPLVAPDQSGPPSKDTSTVSSQASQEPDTGNLSDCSSQSGPCSDSDSIPKLAFEDHPSWDS